MSRLTKGRRFYLPADPMAVVHRHLDDTRAGDYWHWSLGWAGKCPNGLLCNLSKHAVTEHEDETITVSPSILCDNGRESWHGYLEQGVWKEC